MNCSDRVTLQKYLDNELDDKMSAGVDLHLQACEKCRELLAEVNSDREQVRGFLSGLNNIEDPISIPSPPPISEGPHRRRIVIPKLVKAAAGIALLIGLFWILRTELRPKSTKMTEAELLFLEMIGDTEPNKSWHDSQTLIVYTDENGEVIQSFINRN